VAGRSNPMVDWHHFYTKSPQTWLQHKGGSEEEYSIIVDAIHWSKEVSDRM
jgi:hypothetical protein